MMKIVIWLMRHPQYWPKIVGLIRNFINQNHDGWSISKIQYDCNNKNDTKFTITNNSGSKIGNKTFHIQCYYNDNFYKLWKINNHAITCLLKLQNIDCNEFILKPNGGKHTFVISYNDMSKISSLSFNPKYDSHIATDNENKKRFPPESFIFKITNEHKPRYAVIYYSKVENIGEKLGLNK